MYYWWSGKHLRAKRSSSIPHEKVYPFITVFPRTHHFSFWNVHYDCICQCIATSFPYSRSFVFYFCFFSSLCVHLFPRSTLVEHFQFLEQITVFQSIQVEFSCMRELSSVSYLKQFFIFNDSNGGGMKFLDSNFMHIPASPKLSHYVCVCVQVCVNDLICHLSSKIW